MAVSVHTQRSLRLRLRSTRTQAELVQVRSGRVGSDRVAQRYAYDSLLVAFVRYYLSPRATRCRGSEVTVTEHGAYTYTEQDGKRGMHTMQHHKHATCAI